MKDIEAKTFIEAIEATGNSARCYSGRNMYGRNCVGVVLDSYHNEYSFLFKLAMELVSLNEEGWESAESILDELSQMSIRKDSMGKYDTIMYFPNMEWPSEEEEEEDLLQNSP